MATMEAAINHPPLPGSPTLTNPDMILPDERASSSDEYEPLRDPTHAPMMMWENVQAAASGTSLPQMQAYYTGRGMSGPLAPPLQHSYGSSIPIAPTTPIIYGNGTMLSDIGEVTEVESTPGKPPSVSSRSRSSGRASSVKNAIDSGSDAALRSSPTMGNPEVTKARSKANLAAAKQQRERRGSIESNSTITTQDQALFADFDDSVSVGDSVFQGDDEESVADSYADAPLPQPNGTATGLLHPRTSTRERNVGTGVDGNEDGYSVRSTASISRRAEQILANAKRRLTTMEGNLTRARSSLHSPMSSDGSTPSPPIMRATSALHQHTTGPESPTYSPGHARMSSDHGVNPSNSLPRVYPQRSASALGAAGGYRQPMSGPRSVEHLRDSFAGHYKSRNYTAENVAALEPLGEDDVLPTPTIMTTTAPAAESASPQDRRVSSDRLLSAEFTPSAERGLTRPASAAQMRDLKDQMKDLKGKISSLREQARADSLKRRSLQSLRTPSPFTHAQLDPWYEPKQSEETDDADNGLGRNPWNGELSSVDGEGQEAAKRAENEEEEDEEEARTPTEGGVAEESPVDRLIEHTHRASYIRHPSSQQAVPQEALAGAVVAEMEDAPPENGADMDVEDDKSDLETQNGDAEDEEEDRFEEAVVSPREEDNAPGDVLEAYQDNAYESESGESFYHDTLQHPISHEDREDAFDYEHFFLHSAMGTISQQRLARRASSDGYSSEDSVETTKGPTTDNALVRRSSSASMSTLESFATAEETRSIQAADENDVVDQVAQVVSLTSGTVKRSGSSAAAVRRTVLGPIMTNGAVDGSNGVSLRDIVLRRPLSSAAGISLHSSSSFESVGTNRSFPLVNKPVGSTLANGDHLSLDDSEAVHERDEGAAAPNGSGTAAAMQMLAREDQALVERLVASLGKCVLGLTESGRDSPENSMFRRRIDAAMKMLEGAESPPP